MYTLAYTSRCAAWIAAATPSITYISTYPQANMAHTAIHRTLSVTFAASECACSSAATTSGRTSFLTAKCRGSLSSCARADSRQCQHTTHAVSQQRGKKAVCSCLLPLCESVMRTSCQSHVQHICMCIASKKECFCVCE